MRDVSGNGGEPLRWDMEEDGYSLLPLEILHPLEWEPYYDEEWERDLLRLHQVPKDRWRRVHTHWEPVLEALQDGARLPEAHRRAVEAMPEREEREVRFIVRKVVAGLRRLGLAEVETPPVDDVFGDRFEVVEELGRGGMGIVWRCRDLQDDGREVAVKHAWNWVGRFESRERYLREEAELMARFDHPGIVRPILGFEHDGRFHLARDLVEGPSLKQMVRDDGFGPDHRARRLREVTKILVHLREKGYLVLDLKTSNFRLDQENDQVVLMDLGLMEPLVDGQAEAPGFPGTRKYQDPHIMNVRWTDERASVYSLGKILYESVVGHSPKARGHYESYFEQKELDLERMAEDGATEEELELFSEACSPDPDDRPQTLEAFSKRLG